MAKNIIVTERREYVVDGNRVLMVNGDTAGEDATLFSHDRQESYEVGDDVSFTPFNDAATTSENIRTIIPIPENAISLLERAIEGKRNISLKRKEIHRKYDQKESEIRRKYDEDLRELNEERDAELNNVKDLPIRVMMERCLP